MSDVHILFEIELGPRHVRTGNTTHYAGGVLLPAPHSLRIVKLEPGFGFYLFHYDPHGEEMTDTFHDTVKDAMRQAQWEFGIAASDWKAVS